MAACLFPHGGRASFVLFNFESVLVFVVCFVVVGFGLISFFNTCVWSTFMQYLVMPEEGIRSSGSEVRELGAAMWVLGIEPGTFGRVVSGPAHISTAEPPLVQAQICN
ncbi:rCG63574 [Rattus norvegicus]|uniref:RCG63574 n=1 Tax=Rattus norvegicus TaxID=10116 RepID=A6ID67_RAT|nr:rCG63574 [Rattus norvegicus]